MNAPLLVIHGTADPVHPIEHGVALADAVAGAKLVRLDGGGHELHRAAWDPIIDAIVAHTVREAADDLLGRFVAQRAVDKVDDFALQKNSNGQWSPDGIRLRGHFLSNDIESIRRYFALNP